MYNIRREGGASGGVVQKSFSRKLKNIVKKFELEEIY